MVGFKINIITKSTLTKEREEFKRGEEEEGKRRKRKIVDRTKVAA